MRSNDKKTKKHKKNKNHKRNRNHKKTKNHKRNRNHKRTRNHKKNIRGRGRRESWKRNDSTTRRSSGTIWRLPTNIIPIDGDSNNYKFKLFIYPKESSKKSHEKCNAKEVADGYDSQSLESCAINEIITKLEAKVQKIIDYAPNYS
jgi:hypothetical protein